MRSLNATAHKAGVVYFVFMILGIVGEFVLPRFMVPGDAEATANMITASEFTYRIDILNGFVTLVLFIFLVEILYRLFRDVDRTQARLMVLLVTAGVSVSLANMVTRFLPLVLLGNDDYLSVFTKPQLSALVLSSLGLHSNGANISMGFWGLWLFPFGILVMKSGFLPRILGILLMVAGVGYVVTSATAIAWPDHRAFVSRLMMPLYFGEVPIIFWLLIKGVKAPRPLAQSSLAL